MKLIQTFRSASKEDAASLVAANGKLIKLDDSNLPVKETDLFVLHMAVQVAPVDTVRHLYGQFKASPLFDLNLQEPTKGDTVLHVAARYGRSDVVMYLMSLDELNDTIVNAAGQEPTEVARTPELAEAMQVVRAQYLEKILKRLKQGFATSDIADLEDLLSIPRARALIDLNWQDPSTGSTVLHEFVKAKNVPMVKFILANGGDPFRRNSSGVLPIDTTKDETIKRLLKQSTKVQGLMPPKLAGVGQDDESTQLTGPAPSMKGFLKKWTNFTSGYKLRWFVLEDGVLSYYKRQGDTENACRGSINMKQAKLHLGSTEKLQFEVVSKGSVKFNLKANHPVETSRWVWALTNAIQYAKEQDRIKSTSGHRRYPSTASSIAASRLTVPASDTGLHKQNSRHSAISSTSLVDDDSEAQSMHSTNVARILSMNNELSRGDSNSDDDDVDDHANETEAPFTDELVSCEDSVRIGLTSVESTIKSLRESKNNLTLTSEVLDDGLDALEQAMGMVNTLVTQYSTQVNSREEYYKRQIEKSDELQAMWATTIRDLEAERDKIEGHLHRALVQRRQTNQMLREVSSSPLMSPRGSLIPTIMEGQATGPGALNTPMHLVDVNELTAKLKGGVYESDDSDDEFFDALVEGPKLREGIFKEPAAEAEVEAEAEGEPSEDNVLQHEDASKLTDVQQNVLDKMVKEKSFQGYEDGIRKKLALSEDDRPKISLWGVLKSLIGKDMTKMTLPVSFNECTNLLMRSAEDMEYTDLLDTAASIVDDAGKRMVYVAGYAASSYSSTIDRIAKPFNPLLGETFEYSRPDKGYRMFSEQVSHHPPVGALIAESPRWDFYGASNVKSKFNGRSFDINPLGLWYITLRPNKGCEVEEEVYSFRKVTSSVVGIITGSPTVDNYGDMEITNHTLGYKCILKFKARGWRGANAYEVKGTVVNQSGVPQWIVGGRWNDQIFAKKLAHETAVDISNGLPVSGDSSANDKSPSSFANESSERIVVWQVHERPKAPFNLTAFAITLNALPESLKPWVAPTDTRLRPDQRAMEEGRYDEAADEKLRVEEKQRAARRVREQTGEQYKPRWFETRKHGVSGEQYWAYKGTYWPTRAAGQLADKGDIF